MRLFLLALHSKSCIRHCLINGVNRGYQGQSTIDQELDIQCLCSQCGTGEPVFLDGDGRQNQAAAHASSRGLA